MLTQDYINRLIERGFPGCYVEDELSNGIEIEEVVSQELRNEGVDALRRGDIDAAIDVARQIADQLINSSVVSLDMIDLRSYDDYTYRHSVNVAVISTIIGMNLEFNKIRLSELCVAAILHDIGKLQVEPDILNKKGRLTEEEYEIVKNHPTYGYEMINQRLDLSSGTKAAILLHHENEDGSGYPKGLCREQIYVYAKIIHVADVFDALTSKRPYKPAYARSEAVEYLMGSCDRLFNREVVKAFVKSVPIYPKGSMVLLSNGTKAIVIGNSENVMRPKIRMEDGQEIDLADMSDNRNITIVPENKEEVI